MQLSKYLGLIFCILAIVGCNNGTNSTSQNSQFESSTLTLADGTTITIPSTNLYIPHNQTLQVPITIVGGNSANGESLMISASLTLKNQVANTKTMLNESPNAPVISTSPAVVTVSPHMTNTVYLDINDSNSSVGTYSISIEIKDINTNVVIHYPVNLMLFIIEHTCTTTELQSCNQANCFAYVTPAIASVNQGNLIQYRTIAVKTTSSNCYADITNQTTWNSTSKNIANIESSGQASGISIGDTVITAGSNTYSINYLWSQSSELSVVPTVPYPGGYGGLSVTNLGDVTYSCSNGLNKPIYIMVNNGTGILGQVAYGWFLLSGYVVSVSKENMPIYINSTGYGETLALTAGHPFSLNVKECQEHTPYHLNILYGATVNGYTYPELSSALQIKVID